MSKDEYEFGDDMEDEGDDQCYEEDETGNDDFVQFEDPRREQAIQVFEEDQLLQQQNEIVQNVSDLLNVIPGAAATILRHFRWNYDELSQKYFEDPEKLRKALGLDLGKAKPFEYGQPGASTTCQICFDECPRSNTLALNCLHWFCRDCWMQYLSGKVDDGPSCVQTHCPAPKCWQAVDELLFQELLPQDTLARYQKFLLRSFVEDNPNIRWCPSPHCNKAVLCRDPKRLLVQCLCSHRFCFVCGEEAHAPVKCEQLRLWRVKEKGEGDNSKWIFANTKACPQCQSPIQKNDGCNHMTCSKCKGEFCWICLGEWSKHGSSWYKCNYYDSTKTDAEEKEKGAVRKQLERYVFYYTRYHAHLRSREFNKGDLQRAEAKADSISQECAVNADFIVKAVEQLIENRTMLQYTYIYAYYLSDDDKGKHLFEFLQQKLEAITEDFNTLLKNILDEPNPATILHLPEYSQEKVANLTTLARNQLHQLLKGVFEEEEAMACDPAALSKEPPPPPSASPPPPTLNRSLSHSLSQGKGRVPLAAIMRAFSRQSSSTAQDAEPPASRPSATAPTPTSREQAPIPNLDEKLSKLASMGFDHDQSLQALRSADGNLETAIFILLAR
eukprot:GGOE01005546.1.p1 GENE.GGOE01005546.1~~GGOE01005546.1.p1  ORF type:complete len:630 (+),score=206.80 GGOE01005546.1:54-1892(+)